ncbi:hypothetical protein Leryth_024987 [Lithospermum erythrorhizon]|nr:hypothetical protein Leryth_024987 [Lithospermum erythrorhizon]
MPRPSSASDIERATGKRTQVAKKDLRPLTVWSRVSELCCEGAVPISATNIDVMQKKGHSPLAFHQRRCRKQINFTTFTLLGNSRQTLFGQWILLQCRFVPNQSAHQLL